MITYISVRRPAKYDDEGELVDCFSIQEPERTSVEGYRLI
jgi:hypothetical protein